MSLYTYLAQARIDQGPLQSLCEDLPLPSNFVPTDLRMHLWMSLEFAQSFQRSFYESLDRNVVPALIMIRIKICFVY